MEEMEENEEGALCQTSLVLFFLSIKRNYVIFWVLDMGYTSGPLGFIL